MLLNKDIKKVLMIGSGPIVIGQAKAAVFALESGILFFTYGTFFHKDVPFLLEMEAAVS